MRRTASGWQEMGWDEALDFAARGLRDVQARHGADAVALYQGNPSVHNLGTMSSSPLVAKALGTKNLYSASSVDQFPHHYVAQALYGHPLLIPVPDIDRAHYVLMLGANPIASNGSLMTAPGIARRLRAVRERGGRLVLIDPRATETAAVADEHHFIRPARDALFLAALVATIFADGLARPGALAAFTDGIDAVRDAVAPFTAERVAGACGIDAATIRRIARDFAQAPAAVAYGRVGVSMQSRGTLSQWLVNVLNIVTGNLDREGGAMFTTPAVDLVAGARPRPLQSRWTSRVRGLGEFLGELPVAVLAEEIATPGAGQVRALVTSCGNPVLSTPNGGALDTALASLEFMVAIDIYRNETTRHAHVILPPTTGVEVTHYDLTFHLLAVRNTAKYSPALFPRDDDARHDWEILQGLASRLRGEPAGTPVPPEAKLDQGLRHGPYALSLDALRDAPHGIDLGPLQPRLPARLVTADQRIALFPDVMRDELAACEALLVDETDAARDAYPFALIGRRHVRDNNSWLHNAHRLVKGKPRCTLLMHADDARACGFVDGMPVRATSRVGAITLPLEVTDGIARGVVSIPHGYGHDRDGVELAVARAHAGVSINDLTDDALVDGPSGNAAFSDVRVRVEAA